MPQMSPFNWLVMFLLFVIAFTFILCKLFIFQPNFSQIKSKESYSKNNYLNKHWMW